MFETYNVAARRPRTDSLKIRECRCRKTFGDLGVKGLSEFGHEARRGVLRVKPIGVKSKEVANGWPNSISPADQIELTPGIDQLAHTSTQILPHLRT